MGYMSAAKECLPAFRAGTTMAVADGQVLESPAELAVALDALGEPYDVAVLVDVFREYHLFAGEGGGLDLESFVRLAMRPDLECVLSGRPSPTPNRPARQTHPQLHVARSRRRRLSLQSFWRVKPRVSAEPSPQLVAPRPLLQRPDLWQQAGPANRAHPNETEAKDDEA